MAEKVADQLPVTETPVVTETANQTPPVTPTPETLEAKAEAARVKAEKEAAYWQGVAEGGARVATPAPAQIPADSGPIDPGPEPKYEDFTTPGEFESARTKWMRDCQKFDAAKIAEEGRIKAQREATVMTFDSRLAAAAKVDPEIFNLRDIVGKRVTKQTAQIIMESELAPRLIRYLHDNPAEIGRINAYDPMRAAKEVAKIELGMEESSAKAAGAVKTETSAPPPTPTVKAGGPAPVSVDPGDPESDKLPIDDWVAKRRQQRLAQTRVRIER